MWIRIILRVSLLMLRYMKFALEEAMKAQRGSKGIALLFL
jgi:hypothetical protein